MNSLLHSKRFKKNLLKWLMMYCGALCMLTIVVTYSKYITTYNSTADEARVAKFALDMTYSKLCEEQESGTTCDMGNTRPEEYLEYEFNIDATKGEVDTLVVADITINDSFELATNDETQMYEFQLVSGNNNMSSTLSDNKIELTGTMKSGTINTYKIKLRYKEYNTEAYKSAINYDEILKVDYAATQANN